MKVLAYDTDMIMNMQLRIICLLKFFFTVLQCTSPLKVCFEVKDNAMDRRVCPFYRFRAGKYEIDTTGPSNFISRNHNDQWIKTRRLTTDP